MLAEGHAEKMAELAELHAARAPDRPPTRAQGMRLRRIARDESTLAAKAKELAEAIEAEGTMVAAHFMREVEGDMLRIASAIGREGDYETGERTQARGRDVEENLLWLAEALRQEQMRRQNEQRNQDQQNQQDQQGENVPQTPPLIPDTTELKLLRRMEVDLQEAVQDLLTLYPELESGEEVDELILEDITRLANRHEEITNLFQALRERLGLEPPPEEGE